MLIYGDDFGYHKKCRVKCDAFPFPMKIIIAPLVPYELSFVQGRVLELPMTHWFWSSSNQICTNYV